MKREMQRRWPAFRFAFSRPGFVTFKLPDDSAAGLNGLGADVDVQCVLARAAGFCLGKVTGDTAEAIAEEFWEIAGKCDFQHLHVWQRDDRVPGDRGFEPGETELAAAAGEILLSRRPAGRHDPHDQHDPQMPRVNQIAEPGEKVLNCIIVEPQQWWIGWHQAAAPPSCWPGGVPPIDLPDDTVSRAYLKISEALLWSQLPIQAGDRCVEIGSSPGGSCQALLDRGQIVTGIDPAEMDPKLLAHPNFTHIRARAADLKRREFRKTRWLMADSNVAPEATLHTVEHIVTNRQVDIRGLLLTLKLPDWEAADSIPGYVDRVRSWGYNRVQARQLAFNRQEICVAASKK